MNTQSTNPYQQLSQIAFAKLDSFHTNGVALFPQSTVCVLVSATNKYYCEASNPVNINGRMQASHSERDVYQIMCNCNDPTVAYILLMDAQGRPIIPCTGCLQYLVAMNGANINAAVVLPDKLVPVSDFVQAAPPQMGFATQMYGMPAQSMNPYAQVSAPMPSAAPQMMSMSTADTHEFIDKQTQNSNENLLREQVGKLLQGSTQLYDDELPDEAKTKKKRFGLF